MGIDPDSLCALLRGRLGGEVRVEPRPDGALLVRTGFAFPDGDRLPIRLSESPAGGFRLPDQGRILMRFSCEHDVDSFLDGARGALLERIMGETGLERDGGAFCLDAAPGRLAESLSAFGRALTRVHGLARPARARAGAAFYDELRRLPLESADEGRIHPDYRPPAPNAGACMADFMIECGNGIPLFLYGIPDPDKARRTTIMLGQLRRCGVAFESLPVFDDQTKIPRLDLARLSDAGGEMISALESREGPDRRLRRRIAA